MAEDYLKKLIKGGVISADQLDEAKALASSLGVSVEDGLVRLGYLTAAEITQRPLLRWSFLRRALTRRKNQEKESEQPHEFYDTILPR